MQHVLALLILLLAPTAWAGPPCARMPTHSGGFAKHCTSTTTVAPTTTLPPTTTTTTLGPALQVGTACGAPLGDDINPFVTLTPGDPVRCVAEVTNAGGGTLPVEVLELAIHHAHATLTFRTFAAPLGPGASHQWSLDSVVSTPDAVFRCNGSLAPCADDTDCPGELCVGFCDASQDACLADDLMQSQTCTCQGVLPATAAVELTGGARSSFGAGVAVALP